MPKNEANRGQIVPASEKIRNSVRISTLFGSLYSAEVALA